MDTKLENGAFVQGTDGNPVAVGGLDELLQQAYISIAIPRGSFAYDRKLGGDRSLLDKYEDPIAGAEAMAVNALERKKGIRVTGTRLTEQGAVYEISTPLGKGMIKVVL